MDIRKVTAITDASGNVTGNRTRVKVIKNKRAPPFRIAEFDINYSEGISRIGSILDVATDLGILEKRGSWFSMDGEQLGQGREQTKALLESNEELANKVAARVREKLSGTPAAAENAGAAETAE